MGICRSVRFSFNPRRLNARIAVNHRVLADPLLARFQQRVLLRVQAETLIHFCQLSSLRGSGHSNSHASPPRAEPLHLAQPPWLQFRVPFAVPLYPVDKIRLDRTRSAPTRRFIQFERWLARLARVYNQRGSTRSSGGAIRRLTMKYVSQPGRNRSSFNRSIPSKQSYSADLVS